jgi:hypothetical protein
MLFCVAGDVHGELDRLYREVEAFERSIGTPFQGILQVGDLGIWPDAEKVDKATRKHGNAGDFPRWWAEKKEAPVSTLFIKGNHEDHEFLTRQACIDRTILPGLTYLPNGVVIDLEGEEGLLRVAGLGGCHSNRDAKQLWPGQHSPRHYSGAEVRDLLDYAEDHVDVLLMHDAPHVVSVGMRDGGGSSLASSLTLLVQKLRPRIAFFGHHHQQTGTVIDGIPCVGLNIIGQKGHMVAWESSIPNARDGLLAGWPA